MRTALALLLGACLSVGVAIAVDDTGTSSEYSYEYQQLPDRECSIYLYPSDGMSEAARIRSLGYEVTVGGNASYGVISQYDVLMISLVGPGSCPYAADIEQFVNEGGGLIIHQPNGLGTVDYAPPGFEFVIADNFWCDPPYANTIVNAMLVAGVALSVGAWLFPDVIIRTLVPGFEGARREIASNMLRGMAPGVLVFVFAVMAMSLEGNRPLASTVLNFGRHSGHPSELICTSTSETESLENKVTSRKISSTSTSGESTPKISALSW